MSSRPSHPGFVGRDNQLSRIVQRVEALNEVLGIVRSVLPPPLARLCMGVAWHGPELLVAVPHSAAASRLRMAEPAIIEALHKAGWNASTVRPRVQVALQNADPGPLHQLHMTDAALEAFAELAHEVENPELRKAVEALLKHQRRSSS